MTSAIEQLSAGLDGLRVTLRTAGYTSDSVEEAISAGEGISAPGLRSTVGYIQTERDDDPLAALVRLFWLAAAETREKVDRVLPDLPVDDLVEAGILTIEDDYVRSHLRIDDVFGLLIASDIDHERDDHVVGVSPSTRLAATHTPHAPARTALDVGCGQGLQALLAARHCDSVVATDFNERALWMTQLNARLNDLTGIETRQGSFLQPVVGERFDLVVINPPYVVSPGARFLYRDGGFEGDELSRTLLAELPTHLNDGGFGVLQGNWIHPEGDRWFAPIERGLAGSGCDAMLARISTAPPLQYAASWNEPHYVGDPQGFGRVITEWMEHFEEQGIERISGAMVVLRRQPEGAHWRRAVSLARMPTRLGGTRLAKLFETQDQLAELDDYALLGTRLRAPEELRVERYQRPGQKPTCVLDLDEALGVRRPIGPDLAEVVLRLDGFSPVRMVDGAFDDLGGLRALIKLGFLTFD